MRTLTITIIAMLVLPTLPLVAQGGATTAVEASIRAARRRVRREARAVARSARRQR